MQLTCPSCQDTLTIPDEYAGRTGKCNRCGALVQAPERIEPKYTFKCPACSAVQSFPASRAGARARCSTCTSLITYPSPIGADPPPVPKAAQYSGHHSGPHLYKPQRSTLANVSFWLGVFSPFCTTFLTGVPAIVCGHLALNEIKNSPLPLDGRNRAITGLVGGYVGCSMFFVFMISSAFEPGGVATTAFTSPAPASSQTPAPSAPKVAPVAAPSPIAEFRETLGSIVRHDPADATLAEFNRIRNGMSYTQVAQIIGSEGELISENSFPDFQGGQLVTSMYTWSGGGIANMNAMFQNDELISKAQLGLK